MVSYVFCLTERGNARICSGCLRRCSSRNRGKVSDLFLHSNQRNYLFYCLPAGEDGIAVIVFLLFSAAKKDKKEKQMFDKKDSPQPVKTPASEGNPKLTLKEEPAHGETPPLKHSEEEQPQPRPSAPDPAAAPEPKQRAPPLQQAPPPQPQPPPQPNQTPPQKGGVTSPPSEPKETPQLSNMGPPPTEAGQSSVTGVCDAHTVLVLLCLALTLSRTLDCTIQCPSLLRSHRSVLFQAVSMIKTLIH